MTSTTSETRSLRADDPGTLVVPALSGEARGEKLLSDNVLTVGDAFVGPVRGKP